MNKDAVKKALEDNIVEMLGIGAVGDEEKDQLLDEMSDYILLKVTTRVNDKLSVEDQAVLLEMIDSKTSAELFEWLKSKGVSFEEIFLEEIAATKEEMKQRADLIK